MSETVSEKPGKMREFGFVNLLYTHPVKTLDPQSTELPNKTPHWKLT